MVASLYPMQSVVTNYELDRQIKKDPKNPSLDYLRNKYYPYLITCQKILESLFLICLVLMLVDEYGAPLGVLISIGLVLFYGKLANIDILKKITNKYYLKFEKDIFIGAETFLPVLKIVNRSLSHNLPAKIQSREELSYDISRARSFVSDNEYRILQASLEFEKKLVKDYMTPRSVTEVLDGDELLGPLILDKLYKSGHSHFPVIEGGIDKVVGVFHLRETLASSGKKSVKVCEVMSEKVYYINEQQTLGDALKACIKTKRHLLIVINEYRETTGVISLEDVMEVLLGQKIIDEYDNHEDLREVALRNSKNNNSPLGSVDV